MDIAFWLFALGMGAVCWWLGFIATKRMRENKYKNQSTDIEE
jgi:hypothetical protein